MPPVQAGMLPSALAAFSPPRGVRSSPRWAASCGLTAAQALGSSSRAAAAIRIRVFICKASLKARGALERVLHARGDEVAVVQQVVLPGAAVLSVRHVEIPALTQVRAEAGGQCMAPLDEVAAGTRGDAVDVLRPGDVGQEVHARDEVAVL